jgi:hypothetical protein
MSVFAVVYREELERALKETPELYAWPITELDNVLARMLAGLAKGSANKDSPPIKRTCKRLGIKHTYKAIQEQLAKE